MVVDLRNYTFVRAFRKMGDKWLVSITDPEWLAMQNAGVWHTRYRFQINRINTVSKGLLLWGIKIYIKH